MTIWRDDVVNALRAVDGIGSLKEIYNQVERIRTAPLPLRWHAIVRRELEHNSSDSKSYQGRFDLFYSFSGLGRGIWGLRELEQLTPIAVDAKAPTGLPKRSRLEVYRLLRDTRLARDIKKLQGNCCQVCGHTIKLPNGENYSEAHHIQPLGEPHTGPDIAENIIVLCPNHHVQFDYGVVELKEEKLRLHKEHEIGQKYIDYHQRYIFQTETNAK